MCLCLRLQLLDEENSELRSCVPCLRANIERLEEVRPIISHLLVCLSLGLIAIDLTGYISHMSHVVPPQPHRLSFFVVFLFSFPGEEEAAR